MPTDPTRGRPDGGASASPPGARRRLEATVRGRVQGVGFRRYVQTWARRLALGGWVRNEPDGTVTLCAEGDAAAVERLARLLWGGSPVARVDAVETTWTELRNPAPAEPVFVVERGVRSPRRRRGDAPPG